ncbi:MULTISPECIES: hypothetical protein [Lysobacter]|uniref:hypothetical protein n=1 Tax=Lysobacter TaxID=68 RepID=UPI001F390727|nr:MULTISPECIES: hypothetical protein [Lysobacter]UJB20961.1 hypothetical protein L1A79_07850 [Lysobacter capsici]UJQ29924.1 hypothetical protein L2D09_07005 [Lysobacter gummosus]
MLKNRTVDFESLADRIEKVRGAQDIRGFDIDLYEITAQSGVRTCFLCGFPLRDCSVPAQGATVICFGCLNRYVEVEDYAGPLARFKASVEHANRQVAALLDRMNNGQAIDETMLDALLKGLPLTEVEFYIGLPKRFGSFDHGLESGFWAIAGAEFEVWFQSQICVSVNPV